MLFKTRAILSAIDRPAPQSSKGQSPDSVKGAGSLKLKTGVTVFYFLGKKTAKIEARCGTNACTIVESDYTLFLVRGLSREHF